MRSIRTSCQPTYQKGATFLATIMLVAIIGLFMTAALKLAPSYLDNNIVQDAMDGLISENDFAAMSVNDIKKELELRLRANNVSAPVVDAVELVRESGREYIDINYEDRVSIFYNIEAVVIFENRFEKD